LESLRGEFVSEGKVKGGLKQNLGQKKLSKKISRGEKRVKSKNGLGKNNRCKWVREWGQHHDNRDKGGVVSKKKRERLVETASTGMFRKIKG